VHVRGPRLHAGREFLSAAVTRVSRQDPEQEPPGGGRPAAVLAHRGKRLLDDVLAGGWPRCHLPVKIFSEKISTRVRVRPQFEAALAPARQIKAHAPHCRVILTVYE
jgi:hypothetical protein